MSISLHFGGHRRRASEAGRYARYTTELEVRLFDRSITVCNNPNCWVNRRWCAIFDNAQKESPVARAGSGRFDAA